MEHDSSQQSPLAYHFGQWQLSLANRQLISKEQTKTLEPLVFDLLLYFLENADRIVSRQDLIDGVWKQGFVDDNAINRAMSELRKNLATPTQKNTFIKTHYKKGYSFEPEVEAVFSKPTTSPKATGEQETSTSSGQSAFSDSENLIPQSKKSYTGLILLFFIIAFVALIVWQVNTGLLENNNASNSNQPKVITKEAIASRTDLLFKKGLTLFPIASHNQRFVAYSHRAEGEGGLDIYFKDLSSHEDFLVVSREDEAFPVAIDNDGNLVYQTLYARENTIRCQIWFAPYSRSANKELHQKLFDCEGNNNINGELINKAKTLIYTKTNYRNNIERSALYARNLETGDEYQITSPSIANMGDQFLAVSPNEQKIVFYRDGSKGGSLYLTDLEGSEKTLLLDLDYKVTSMRWNISNNKISWLNYPKWEINTLNLETNEITVSALNYDYSLNVLVSIAMLSEKRFVMASNYLDHDVYGISLTDPEPQVMSILDSFSKELRYLPLDEADNAAFIVDANTIQLWSKRAEVRQKIQSYTQIGVPSFSRSPEGQFFLVGFPEDIYIYKASDYSAAEHIKMEGDVKHVNWLNSDELIMTKNVDGQRKTVKYSLSKKQFNLFSDFPSEKVAIISENLIAIEDFDAQLHIFDYSGNLVSTQAFEKYRQIVWVANETTLFLKRIFHRFGRSH